MAVISKENKKKLAKTLDEAKEWNNPLLEGADGWFYGIAIGAFDENVLMKINVKYHPLIDKAAGELGDKNFQAAAATVGEILAMAINTPLIDGTEAEIELYTQVLQLVEQLIRSWIKKEAVPE